MRLGRPSYWLRPAAIVRVLDQRGWSQAGLASDIGINRVSLSRYLHQHRPVGLRSRQRLIAWATTNGIAPDALLERRQPASE
jgi:transcriptional regulator with XRE-family HTH domain